MSQFQTFNPEGYTAEQLRTLAGGSHFELKSERDHDESERTVQYKIIEKPGLMPEEKPTPYPSLFLPSLDAAKAYIGNVVDLFSPEPEIIMLPEKNILPAFYGPGDDVFIAKTVPREAVPSLDRYEVSRIEIVPSCLDSSEIDFEVHATVAKDGKEIRTIGCSSQDLPKHAGYEGFGRNTYFFPTKEALNEFMDLRQNRIMSEFDKARLEISRLWQKQPDINKEPLIVTS